MLLTDPSRANPIWKGPTPSDVKGKGQQSHILLYCFIIIFIYKAGCGSVDPYPLHLIKSDPSKLGLLAKGQLVNKNTLKMGAPPPTIFSLASPVMGFFGVIWCTYNPPSLIRQISRVNIYPIKG